MTLRLNGATSGYTEIDAPAVAGSNTLVLPTGNGTADQVISTNGSGALSFVDRGRMVLETAQASTSGTSVDFTGIPSWVKKITVMFDRVSTSGASTVLIQLGDSGGIENTGYTGASTITGTGSATVAFTAGAGLQYSGQTTSFVQNGAIQIANLTGNTWVIWGGTALSAGGPQTSWTHSAKTLSDPLDRIRITTVNGTDTFDAGSINLLLEG
jgi:hypothetical protein